MRELDAPAASRREFLSRLSKVTAGGVIAGCISGVLPGSDARPAAADTPLDIQILQTASALEAAMVAAYQQVLALDFVKRAPPSLLLFLETTSNQHVEHAMAFRAQTAALGGAQQEGPHPSVAQMVEGVLPGARETLQVVQLAEQIETIATHTFLDAAARLDDAVSRQLMATIMGVESQHAAMLRVAATIVAADAPELVAIPVNPAALPSAVGSVATPDAIERTDKALQPDSGVPAAGDSERPG